MKPKTQFEKKNRRTKQIANIILAWPHMTGCGCAVVWDAASGSDTQQPPPKSLNEHTQNLQYDGFQTTKKKKRCIYSIFGFTCTVRCGDGAGTAAHALDGQCSETCVSIWKRGTWIFQFRPAILKANILRSIALHTILWNDYYFTGDGAPISILNMSFVWAAADCVFGDIRYM